MTRLLAFVSLALTLAGLELSTEALTLAAARLRAGATAALAGVEFHVSASRFATGGAMLLLGLLMAAVVLWASSIERRVSVGRSCPDCGGRTRRVKRTAAHRVASALLGERLTRRKCETCAWLGLSLTT